MSSRFFDNKKSKTHQKTIYLMYFGDALSQSVVFATVQLRINPLEAKNKRSWFYDFSTTKSAETTKTNTLDLSWFGSAHYKSELITTVNLHINPLEAKIPKFWFLYFWMIKSTKSTKEILILGNSRVLFPNLKCLPL